MKDLITRKRFMAVGMKVHWKPGGDISAPSTSFYQIPILRHVRSSSHNRTMENAYDSIHLYNAFFNIQDKDLKNFICIAICLHIVRDLAFDYAKYSITKPIYEEPRDPRVVMNIFDTHEDLMTLRGMDELDLLCKTCGYRYTYGQVKKMEDGMVQSISRHNYIDREEMLNAVAMRWYNAIHDIDVGATASDIQRIQMRCSIQGNDSSYWFLKGALTDPKFMDNKRYILDDSIFHAGAIGDLVPDDRLLTRICLKFHTKCY